MRRGLTVIVLFVAGVAAACYLTQRRAATPAPAPRLNVLLITIDTLRADRVGRGLTPNIDRLAARGASFPNVRASVPLTLPSHVSLMTGTIPPVHGVRENGVVFDRKRPTLARIFKDAGYRTGAFVGAYVLNRRFGLNEGFDVYDDSVRRDAARAEMLEAERPGAEVVDAALKWLDGSAPFFAWVHMYDPHAPYAPPAEFLQKAGGNAYDGEVAYADAQVGRLLAALDQGGLTGSTLVVVTSDHGESLGEHGEQTHGMLVYDSAIRVPLVVAAPAIVPWAVDRPMSLVEVAPGILSAVGLPAAPGGCTSGLVHRAGDPTPRRIQCDVYAESLYPRRAGWHALTTLADDRWKLIRSSESELYEIRTDGSERANVAAQHPSIVQAMAAKLASLATSSSAAPTIAADAADRLRALGYASGSAAITSDDPTAANPAAVISAWVEFEQALGLIASKNAAGALAPLERLVRAHAGAPVFLSTYAQALKESGKAGEAVRIYKQAVARWPGDAALFHDLAAAAREAGDTGEAMRAEQAALALDSTSAMAQNGLGLLHADAGRTTEAIAAFTRATEQDPTNASYWTNLGNARRAAGDAAAAEAAYRKALEVDSEFADALNGLGTLYVQGGRAGDAVALFERALRRDPELHEARLNLGIAFQESGQRDRAAAAYREILAMAPASARREREAAAALLSGLR